MKIETQESKTPIAGLIWKRRAKAYNIWFVLIPLARIENVLNFYKNEISKNERKNLDVHEGLQWLVEDWS